MSQYTSNKVATLGQVKLSRRQPACEIRAKIRDQKVITVCCKFVMLNHPQKVLGFRWQKSCGLLLPKTTPIFASKINLHELSVFAT